MRTVALIFIGFLAACTRSVPGDVIPPGKMMPIMYDMMRADEFVSSFVLTDTSLKPKEQYTKMYEQVFLIHKITRDEFYESLHYYQQHPDKNRVLYDSLHSFATRQKGEVYEHKLKPSPH